MQTQGTLKFGYTLFGFSLTTLLYSHEIGQVRSHHILFTSFRINLEDGVYESCNMIYEIFDIKFVIIVKSLSMILEEYIIYNRALVSVSISVFETIDIDIRYSFPIVYRYR